MRRRVAVVSALASIGAMVLYAGTQGSGRGEAAEESFHRTFKGIMVADLDTPPRRLAAARAGVVRINAGKAVSPTHRFRRVRRYAARLRYAGMRPLPLLQQNMSLTDRQWKAAVRAFAQNVPSQFLEIGNEPGPDAWRRYFHFVRLAAPIIHAEGKSLILGAPMNLYTIRYLRAAKAAGDIFTRVEGLAIHPYAPTPYQVQQLVGQARGIVPRRLPFWITEVGWGTGPNQDAGYGGLDVTADTQARHVTELYNRLFQRGKLWNLASVGYFVWRDYGPGGWQGKNVCHHSGLLRIDGTRKPAYAKYAAHPRVFRQG
jgi:hypothetical protein